jgi:uncharacterized membrane protein YbaN (DUF454 family)
MGTIFVGLGILGIFVPILPSTPFFLLASICYVRSSKKLYNWLLNNRWFGSYIKNYQQGKGIPLQIKIFSISLLWLTILFSAFGVVKAILIRILLFIIAIGVSLHIGFIKTIKSKEKRQSKIV